MYHPSYGRLRMGPPGYYIDQQGQFIPESDIRLEGPGSSLESRTYFGSGFTPAELAKSGVISTVIALILGAGIPGALVMGLGSMIVESGSTRIIPGWRRYVLGLFKKPHV